MNKQPLFILLICFILGVILRDKSNLGSEFGYYLLGFSTILLISSFIKTSFFQHIKNYVLGFFFLSIGFFLNSENSKTPELPQLKEKEIIIFKLDKKLNSNDKNKRYVIDIVNVAGFNDENLFPVKSVISISKNQKDLEYDNFYKAQVYIHKIQKPELDYQFNYKQFLERQNIYYQAFLPNEIFVLKKDDIGFLDKIKQSRLKLLQTINKAPISPKVQEFIKGVILADRTDLNAETIKDFNQTGLVHLLAISGTHMVIIFWMISWVFNLIIPFKFRKLAVILSLLFIWLFACFINFGPSVSRACLMITCYYVMVLLQRKADLLHSLALSAFVILIINTQQLFNVGFQLSYFAVLGILWFTPEIKNRFKKPNNKIQELFINIFSMTLSAQLATLPLSIYYFHQYSFVSIFANLLILPIAEIIIISSLLMVVLIAFSVKITFLYNGFDFFLSNVLSFIHWISVHSENIISKNISLNLVEVLALMVLIFVLKFVIKDFRNTKYQLQFIFCLFIFLGFRLWFDFKAYQKDEVLVHHFFKEKIISVKIKDNVFFWLPENANRDKVEKFIINPYISNNRTALYKVNFYSSKSNYFVYKGITYLIN